MQYFYDVFETNVGWVGVVASEKGLRRVTLPQVSGDVCCSMLVPEIETAEPSSERFGVIKRKFKAYFEGKRVSFDDEPIDVGDATPFYKAAWNACRKIPVGETRTYMWLAIQAGKPLAPRAAGQSMARNRLPIIVPCHRVIGSDGSLRGFGKGTTRLDLKQHLLKMESSYI